jgi:hypothetical protein
MTEQDESLALAKTIYEMASRDSGTALDYGLVAQFADLIRKLNPAPSCDVKAEEIERLKLDYALLSDDYKQARFDVSERRGALANEIAAEVTKLMRARGIDDRCSPDWITALITKHLSTQPAPTGAFLGRCGTCLENAYSTSEPCEISSGIGCPRTEDDCLIRRAQKQAAAQPAPGVSGDWVLVPREPTEAMVEAGRAALSQGDAKVQTHARTMWCYEAMLSTTPAPSPAPAMAVGLTEEERAFIELIASPDGAYNVNNGDAQDAAIWSDVSRLLAIIDRAYPRLSEREKGASR